MTETEILELVGMDPDLSTSHCYSCHEDRDEYGYDMCSIELPDGEELEVCCTVAIAWDTLAANSKNHGAKHHEHG